MSSLGKSILIAVLFLGILAVLYVCMVQAATIANQRSVILEMFNYIQKGCPGVS